jgi:uncharacterized protein (TIGR02001 family)
VRQFAGGGALMAALWVACIVKSTASMAADVWVGSADLTSDYLVRGISRTGDQAAAQMDVYYANSSGFLAGVFASNTQIDPHGPRDVELSGFLGFGWNLSGDWHAKLMASHYAYPWNRQGSHYNYDQVDLDVAYQGWLHMNLGYSPNTPRFLPYPYDRLVGETEKSAEISAQRQIWRRLSLTTGVGYSFLDGPNSTGYTYWSVGSAYDWQSVSLVAAYVETSPEAKVLFPRAAVSGRWMGTLIWRF